MRTLRAPAVVSAAVVVSRTRTLCCRMRRIQMHNPTNVAPVTRLHRPCGRIAAELLIARAVASPDITTYSRSKIAVWSVLGNAPERSFSPTSRLATYVESLSKVVWTSESSTTSGRASMNACKSAPATKVTPSHSGGYSISATPQPHMTTIPRTLSFRGSIRIRRARVACVAVRRIS